MRNLNTSDFFHLESDKPDSIFVGGLVLWVVDGPGKKGLYVLDCVPGWGVHDTIEVTLGLTNLKAISPEYDGPRILSVTRPAFAFHEPDEIREIVTTTRDCCYHLCTFTYEFPYVWVLEVYTTREVGGMHEPDPEEFIAALQKTEHVCYLLGEIREKNLTNAEIYKFIKTNNMVMPIWFVYVDLYKVRNDVRK